MCTSSPFVAFLLTTQVPFLSLSSTHSLFVMPNFWDLEGRLNAIPRRDVKEIFEKERTHLILMASFSIVQSSLFNTPVPSEVVDAIELNLTNLQEVEDKVLESDEKADKDVIYSLIAKRNNRYRVAKAEKNVSAQFSIPTSASEVFSTVTGWTDTVNRAVIGTYHLLDTYFINPEDELDKAAGYYPLDKLPVGNRMWHYLLRTFGWDVNTGADDTVLINSHMCANWLCSMNAIVDNIGYHLMETLGMNHLGALARSAMNTTVLTSDGGNFRIMNNSVTALEMFMITALVGMTIRFGLSGGFRKSYVAVITTMNPVFAKIRGCIPVAKRTRNYEVVGDMTSVIARVAGEEGYVDQFRPQGSMTLVQRDPLQDFISNPEIQAAYKMATNEDLTLPSLVSEDTHWFVDKALLEASYFIMFGTMGYLSAVMIYVSGLSNQEERSTFFKAIDLHALCLVTGTVGRGAYSALKDITTFRMKLKNGKNDRFFRHIAEKYEEVNQRNVELERQLRIARETLDKKQLTLDDTQSTINKESSKYVETIAENKVLQIENERLKEQPRDPIVQNIYLNHPSAYNIALAALTGTDSRSFLEAPMEITEQIRSGVIANDPNVQFTTEVIANILMNANTDNTNRASRNPYHGLSEDDIKAIEEFEKREETGTHHTDGVTDDLYHGLSEEDIKEIEEFERKEAEKNGIANEEKEEKNENAVEEID